MCVCVCVYIYIYMCVCMHIYIYICVCACVSTYIYIRTHMYILSSYIWHLKDTNISPTIIWEILKLAPAYNKISNKCLLILHRKLAIIINPSQTTLLKEKSEILSKCRHKNKHLLSHITHQTSPIKNIKQHHITPEAP